MSTQAQEAREALGARLRGFRKDAGFESGRAFALATGWAESKVSRIENGKQNASEHDIRTWCSRTNRDDQVDDLIATVRHIDELWLEWRRQLATGAEKRQKAALPVYSKTKVFRIWHPTLIWGTLQTAEYAAETFKQVRDYYEIPDDTEAATAKRLERQQYLYQGERIFNVLLAEQALYTNFGGAEVMKGQLDRLLAVMRLARLSLGIVPRSAPPCASGPEIPSRCSMTSSSSWRRTPPSSRSRSLARSSCTPKRSRCSSSQRSTGPPFETSSSLRFSTLTGCRPTRRR
ncbi:helix-turn-helix transcriptional regulator [Streptomyces cinereospinus]